jgi:putative transcription factor
MESCEICGKKCETVYSINIEGAYLLVCKKCSEGHEILNVLGSNNTNQKLDIPKNIEKNDEVIEGYGGIIRDARTKMGLTLKVLAEKINEKESTLRRIEDGKTTPTDKVSKKLEKELGIKLITPQKNDKGVSRIGKNDPITLWDIAIKKKVG